MSTTPFLILESQGGGHVPLTEFTNFGRGEDNAVVFKDIGVSTHHAVIRKESAFWVVEDLGSTNGTWLNHQRVDGPTVIKEGDLLQMGSQRMRVSGFRPQAETRAVAPATDSCPRCYKHLPAQAVFCPACGLPVSAPRAPQANPAWPTSTMPFQVPYPDGKAPAAKPSGRNTLAVAFIIVGVVALVLSVVLGWMLRERIGGGAKVIGSAAPAPADRG